MKSKEKKSARDILNWRMAQLALGGRVVDIDWLLDVGGGLGWESLQRLKIFQNNHYELQKSLDELSFIWHRHINENEPLQYLVGKCPWRDFQLEINSSVFIPRQETEILVELALKKCNGISVGRWADLGTGSGVLAVALARSLPGWIGDAVDCSKDALSLAKKNLANLANNSHVHFHLGHWWQPLKSWWGTYDLVLANPPYIPSAVLSELHPIVRDNEPHLALSGGLDGMNCCREIIRGAKKGLGTGGWLIFEHHYDQSERLLNELIANGFKEVNFENDLEGVRRFAIGRKS
nr:peptide chain release factor N(5)-glutamine methyltransferase [Prochlorococcus marinus]